MVGPDVTASDRTREHGTPVAWARMRGFDNPRALHQCRPPTWTRHPAGSSEVSDRRSRACAWAAARARRSCWSAP